MLALDPKQRCSAAEALEFAWLKDLKPVEMPQYVPFYFHSQDETKNC